MPEGFIPPHGGYANLLSYRKAEIVYDATVYFCCIQGQGYPQWGQWVPFTGRS